MLNLPALARKSSLPPAAPEKDERVVKEIEYAVSKHGRIALTKTAAHEYASRGIRVNAVCPDWTHSEVVDAALADRQR